jgi:hypothetical protein
MPGLYSGQGMLFASSSPILPLLNRLLSVCKGPHSDPHFNDPNIVFAIAGIVAGTTIASRNQAAPVCLHDRDNTVQSFQVRFKSVPDDIELPDRVTGKNNSL